MALFKKDKSHLRGKKFEERVFYVLQKLEPLAFVRELKMQDKVYDRNGNSRKIDISFIMCTYMIELQISIECKSREKNLTLDDINQIKVFKAELPERNLFWIVSDTPAGENVLDSLRKDGISFYLINELETIISNICRQFKKTKIKQYRISTKRFSTMSILRFGESLGILAGIERELLADFKETREMLEIYRGRRYKFGFDEKHWERMFRG